jgi:hypothetical protein
VLALVKRKRVRGPVSGKREKKRDSYMPRNAMGVKKGSKNSRKAIKAKKMPMTTRYMIPYLMIDLSNPPTSTKEKFFQVACWNHSHKPTVEWPRSARMARYFARISSSSSSQRIFTTRNHSFVSFELHISFNILRPSTRTISHREYSTSRPNSQNS